MANTVAKNRPADTRLPHPSWRLTNAEARSGDAPRLADAAEFWNRLGV